MPTVVITGANGFLGSYLVDFFVTKGWKVRALVHNMPKEINKGVEYHLYNLLAKPEQKILEGADSVIHCAYAPGDFNANVNGTKNLVEQSRKCGVKKNIFISSISANGNALAVYGKQKWACEKFYDQPNDLILRPGLILGNGGLFGQMKTYLQKKKLIPLIEGGNQPLQTVYIGNLAEVIYTSIEKNTNGTYTIASPEKLSYKDFYIQLCSTLNVSPTFVSVPHGLLYFCLFISETIGIKLPISRENLLGLKQLKYIDTTTDLNRLGTELKTCSESLRLAN